MHAEIIFLKIKLRETMRKLLYVMTLCLLMTGCNSRTPQYRIGVSQCLDDAWRQKMNYEMERELLLHPDMTLSRRIAYGSNELHADCQSQ